MLQILVDESDVWESFVVGYDHLDCVYRTSIADVISLGLKCLQAELGCNLGSPERLAFWCNLLFNSSENDDA